MINITDKNELVIALQIWKLFLENKDLLPQWVIQVLGKNQVFYYFMDYIFEDKQSCKQAIKLIIDEAYLVLDNLVRLNKGSFDLLEEEIDQINWDGIFSYEFVS